MSYSGYNSNTYSSNTWNSNPKPKKNYGSKASSSVSGGDFQKFLEYLDEAGRAQMFISRSSKTQKRGAL